MAVLNCSQEEGAAREARRLAEVPPPEPREVQEPPEPREGQEKPRSSSEEDVQLWQVCFAL